MYQLNDGLEQGTIDLSLWQANCALITTPCFNKTILKDYNCNRSAYNPDDALFDEMVRFVRLTKPDIVLGEMTPPHELCHEDHTRVAKAIEDLGYNVTVTDRLPSDCCGDLTHRDRWFMVARLRPVGTLEEGRRGRHASHRELIPRDASAFVPAPARRRERLPLRVTERAGLRRGRVGN